MDLVRPAGSLPALKTAVDNGADAVYIGFRDDTNARNFAGLNFDAVSAREGIRYAHSRKRQVFLALNTFPQVAGWRRAEQAVDRAAELEADAVIVADAGLMQYAAATHPQLRLHLSVQGSATNYEAINFYHQHFHIKRAVLPRVLSLAQVGQVIAGTPVEIEVFGFGSLCVMVEGRCVLSSYATGESPNTIGVCSPAKAVRWQQTPAGLESRLNGILIDRYAADENAAYGRLPLAFSARCFTARRYNLSKDSCEFRCIAHPNGTPLLTREGQPFLAFNGIQTQSARTCNLIDELDDLPQLGVDVLRINPQSANTFEVVNLFRQRLERSITADLAARQMASLMPEGACNGYWHGQPGFEQVAAARRTA